MAIILMAIIGVAAGFITAKLMRVDLSALETVAVGLIGVVIGGLILRSLVALSGFGFGLIGAVAGACLAIWVYQRFIRGGF